MRVESKLFYIINLMFKMSLIVKNYNKGDVSKIYLSIRGVFLLQSEKYGIVHIKWTRHLRDCEIFCLTQNHHGEISLMIVTGVSGV